MPGTEIVNRDADADVAQAFEHIDSMIDVLHDGVFRNLECQSLRGDILFFQNLQHEVRQVFVLQVTCGKIYRNSELVTLVAPGPTEFQCAFENIAREMQDGAGLLGSGNKFVRCEVAEFRVSPAY